MKSIFSNLFKKEPQQRELEPEEIQAIQQLEDVKNKIKTIMDKGKELHGNSLFILFEFITEKLEEKERKQL